MEHNNHPWENKDLPQPRRQRPTMRQRVARLFTRSNPQQPTRLRRLREATKQRFNTVKMAITRMFASRQASIQDQDFVMSSNPNLREMELPAERSVKPTTNIGELLKKNNLKGFTVYNRVKGDVDHMNDYDTENLDNEEPVPTDESIFAFAAGSLPPPPSGPPPVPPRKPRRRFRLSFNGVKQKLTSMTRKLSIGSNGRNFSFTRNHSLKNQSANPIPVKVDAGNGSVKPFGSGHSNLPLPQYVPTWKPIKNPNVSANQVPPPPVNGASQLVRKRKDSWLSSRKKQLKEDEQKQEMIQEKFNSPVINGGVDMTLEELETDPYNPFRDMASKDDDKIGFVPGALARRLSKQSRSTSEQNNNEEPVLKSHNSNSKRSSFRNKENEDFQSKISRFGKSIPAPPATLQFSKLKAEETKPSVTADMLRAKAARRSSSTAERSDGSNTNERVNSLKNRFDTMRSRFNKENNANKDINSASRNAKPKINLNAQPSSKLAGKMSTKLKGLFNSKTKSQPKEPERNFFSQNTLPTKSEATPMVVPPPAPVVVQVAGMKMTRDKKLRESINGIKGLAKMWDLHAERNQAKQEANPFSGGFNKAAAKPLDDATLLGSKSAQRAKEAQEWAERETKKLIEVIKDFGDYDASTNSTSITFGRLFVIYEQVSDTLVGMLLKAKKKNLLRFQAGEMLLQGRDDHVVIYVDH